MRQKHAWLGYDDGYDLGDMGLPAPGRVTYRSIRSTQARLEHAQQRQASRADMIDQVRLRALKRSASLLCVEGGQEHE